MLKSLWALAVAGLVSSGAAAAPPVAGAARTVAIQDLAVVGESGGITSPVQPAQYHGGGHHHGGYHGGYHGYHGGYHGGHHGWHHGGYHGWHRGHGGHR